MLLKIDVNMDVLEFTELDVYSATSILLVRVDVSLYQ